MLSAVELALLLTGCADTGKDNVSEGAATEAKLITVGFSQVGAESDWRIANTESMKQTFSIENGYDLIFDDAQQKQEKQITAIRNYIQQEVDYIVVAPVTETGWDTILQEARDANIPVIVVDRMVDVEDDSLYTAWVGSDFELEGKKACAWLEKYCSVKNIEPADIHIVDIQGTPGASAQIGRTEALRQAVEKNGWQLEAVEKGDYTQAKSREVMQMLLRSGKNINVVYCENDNEAFGAIEALEEAGYKVGDDLAAGEVMVMSFDATNMGLQEMLKEKITLNTECNPLQGPRVEEIIKALEQEQEIDKLTFVEEDIFSANSVVDTIEIDGETWKVTKITQEIIDKRSY